MKDKKTILITGGTSGIGKALVEHFDKNNTYEVYFTARNEAKAKDFQQILTNSQYILMDFSSFESIVQGAQQVKSRIPSLDVLINNAGTWQMEFKETQDGVEMNFAVNHLAPMLLTLELMPVLKSADAARIINTSSGAHRRDILDLEDLEYRNKEYNGIATYSQSKLCNLLFSLELSNHLKDTNVTVNTVHPGYVQSSLFDNMGPRNMDAVPTSAHGARSAIYVATSPALEQTSGKYFYLEQEESRISPMATNTQLSHSLWEQSKKYLESHTSYF